VAAGGILHATRVAESQGEQQGPQRTEPDGICAPATVPQRISVRARPVQLVRAFARRTHWHLLMNVGGSTRPPLFVIT
jgi:hypothetical protein